MTNKPDFTEAIEIALRTWYPKDHPLHLNPHHPLGKLLGEWGELLDDYTDTMPDGTGKHLGKLLAKWGKLMDNYMKSVYKPGYEFEPTDELGDIWYYVRILLYQCDNQKYVSSIAKHLSEPGNSKYSVDYIIALAMQDVSELFIRYIYSKEFKELNLTSSILAIPILCKRYNITLDALTHSNWEKLKPGSERGEEWMKARLSTDYVGGKVSKK